MITIRNISQDKSKDNLHDSSHTDIKIKSMAIDYKYFYDMDYIKFHSRLHSSKFKINKIGGTRFIYSKDTIRKTCKNLDRFLHDYECTSNTDINIHALAKYYERWGR